MSQSGPPCTPPLSSPKIFLEGPETILIQNFYVNTIGNVDIRVKIAIFGVFDPKNYLFGSYISYLFSAVVGPIFGLKIIFYYFQQKFFRKKSKIAFFHCFPPKFVIFQIDISGSIFSLKILKKYRFEEFLHILPISTLKRLKIAIFLI